MQLNGRVVLAGNPNAGKTTLFNALTKSSLRTGNFHGVTTSSTQKTVGGVTYVDCPGLYAMRGYSMEEATAAEQIKNAEIIVNVVDALTIENSLNLTYSLIATGKKIVLYITKLNSLKRRGGKLDCDKLSKMLGVPVFAGSAKAFKKYLNGEINVKKQKQNFTLAQVYSAGAAGQSLADKLFYNRFFALFFFLFAIVLMFFTAFHPKMIGSILKDLCQKLIVEDLGELIFTNMQSEMLISLLKEGILGGVGSVLSFIPQLAVLYIFLIILDESGITSALCFATDGLFERVNLSGRAAFSLISGFGCTTAAITTTRGYSTVSAQRRTVAILPLIPCGAKLPVFLTFLSPLFENPFPVITLLYLSALALSLVAACFLKGENEGMLCEVTPISIPSVITAVKKLYFYLKGFIIKVTGVVTLFCIASWLLCHFSFSFEFVSVERSMLAHICKLIAPLFYPMGAGDWRIAYAALCGFIAKENVAATLTMLMPDYCLSLEAAISLSVFMLLSPACVSAFFASVKEVGLKFTLKCFAVQLIISFVGGYIAHLIFLLNCFL